MGPVYPLMNSYSIPELKRSRMDPLSVSKPLSPPILPSSPSRKRYVHVELKAPRGIGEPVKNSLLSLKKRNRRGARIRSYVYQVKRGSFHPQSPVLLPLALPPFLPRDSFVSRFYILYFSSRLVFSSTLFSFTAVVSRSLR